MYSVSKLYRTRRIIRRRTTSFDAYILLIINEATMCVDKVRHYSCECMQIASFEQCQEHRGTNVRCDPVRRERLPDATHMCKKHMVKPGKDELRR